MFETLTRDPSRPGWNRAAETMAMLSWTGDGSLAGHVENCRREGTRKWINHGYEMPCNEVVVTEPDTSLRWPA